LSETRIENSEKKCEARALLEMGRSSRAHLNLALALLLLLNLTLLPGGDAHFYQLYEEEWL